MTREKDSNENKKDMDSVRFVSLISMISLSAYQSMGKLADPETGEAVRNLDAAQGFIDVLSMLRTKTAGNLDPEEAAILDNTISDLQINFVKERRRPPAPAEEPSPPTEAEISPPAEEGTPDGPEPSAEGEDQEKRV